MSQVYHSNAKLNQHSRKIIQNSELTNIELAQRFNINEKTVAKWRNRDFTEDKSSRPKTIHYALNPLEKRLIELVRKTTWMSLDDLVDTVSTVIPNAKRSNVSRTLQSLGISRIPEEKRAGGPKKVLKEYETLGLFLALLGLFTLTLAPNFGLGTKGIYSWFWLGNWIGGNKEGHWFLLRILWRIKTRQENGRLLIFARVQGVFPILYYPYFNR